MKKILYTLSVTFLFLLSGCEDIDTHKPFGANDGKTPGTVTIDSYEKIPGGVKVKFIAPADNDLLYIKIKYKLDTGKEMEARASLYSNEISIEGFGNTNPKTLVVSAVNRNENEGKSISFDVEPGTPACVTAFEELDVRATFGGIYAQTNNDHRNYLFIDVYTTNEEEEWYVAHTEYTSTNNIKFPVRGFDSEPREFRIVIRDSYGNQSETYSTTVTPLYEERLDLTKIKGLRLPGDLGMDMYGPMENMFNGNIGWNEFNFGHSTDFLPDEFPVWFTIDLGQLAQLSRFSIWQRTQSNGEFFYDNGSIKTYEVWGRADQPDASGSWDGWTKLMDCESIKPSGWPQGSKSEEDIEYARKGEDYEFPMEETETPAVRYIRFKILSTHVGSGCVVIQQIWLYGTPVQ